MASGLRFAVPALVGLALLFAASPALSSAASSRRSADRGNREIEHLKPCRERPGSRDKGESE